VVRAFATGLTHYAREWLLHIGIGAAIIFALAPRSRAAQLLLIATGSGGAVVTLAWTAESVGTQFFAPMPIYVSFVLITTFWGWLLLPTLILLVLSFPRRVWPLTRWPWATPIILYALPLAALAAAAVTGSFEIYLAALGLGAATFLLTAVIVTVHTFWRVRDPVVRAQTAWLSLGLALGLGVNPLGFAILLLFPNASVPDAAVGPQSWPLALLSDNLLTLAFLLCMGIAITRYRLFDIAVVINRALVYGLLTASLVVVYFGGVVLLQGLFRALTGQNSNLAIVGSTLASAALFQPLRHRIQRFIDWRFFRRKYDARQVLATHRAVLSDEVDIDQLSTALLRATDDALRPAHLSLWVRGEKERQ
jgi:hypothetical protein